MAARLVSVFLLLVAGTTVLADPIPPLFTFPEDAREAEVGSRIVSGWEASPGQFPYQTSIRMVNGAGGVSSCGGTIIAPKWGMTAAHCTATRVTIVVRCGAVSLARPHYIFETTKYYNHPLYNEAIPSVVQPHDIGLLEFPRTLEFNHLVQPIRIQNSADMNRNYEGDVLIASGWGRTWTNGASPENMNWVYQRGVSNEACRAAFGGSSIIVDSTICSSHYNVTSQSTCQGDSGGCLSVVGYDGKPTQVGVTSFVSGTGCHTDFPAGFIRPGHYHDWFTEISGENFDWEPKESEPSPPESNESAPPSSEDSSSSDDSSSNDSSTDDSSRDDSSTDDSSRDD